MSMDELSSLVGNCGKITESDGCYQVRKPDGLPLDFCLNAWQPVDEYGRIYLDGMDLELWDQRLATELSSADQPFTVHIGRFVPANEADGQDMLFMLTSQNANTLVLGVLYPPDNLPSQEILDKFKQTHSAYAYYRYLVEDGTNMVQDLWILPDKGEIGTMVRGLMFMAQQRQEEDAAAYKRFMEDREQFRDKMEKLVLALSEPGWSYVFMDTCLRINGPEGLYSIFFYDAKGLRRLCEIVRKELPT